MPHSNLQYLPIVLGTALPVTFIWTYIIAVSLRHVEPGFPFISHAGNEIPESCFFGQMLNICAALMTLCVYIRHRQLVSQEPPYRPPLALLKSGLWTGWIASLGVSIVGNFQLESLIIVHGVGAFFAFIIGIPYLWIQVVCTTYDPPSKYSKVVIQTRIVLASIATFSLVVLLATMLASYIMLSLGLKNDVQFGLYLTSAVAEWVMAMAMSAFIVTFAREFQQISLTTPESLKNRCTESKRE
ncbi:DNA damage-regulated autophagy modulator protein 2-like isoform X2 [Neocloeon triangulifer]|uniref:DNA damage-regulated autophagy modulator protein 2-like isoform X2 n=1 Tax=Neocloeon triangulifer TaxID=2078957 RepID=UPI00286ED230|nr:DNA damage-regulated autophagy modulator protein 2-like isoform X2 [Neocloeon triangulifer]